MTNALIHDVVATLRVSGPPMRTLERLAAFSEGRWRKFLPWIDESGLALYFLERLRAVSAQAVLPRAIRERLEHDLETNWHRLATMKQEFGSLVRAFDALGVDYAVLKGFAMVPEFCTDAALRSQFDYDFLVHPRSAARAHRALVQQGYSLKVKSPGHEKDGESLYSAEPLAIPSSGENFYSPNIPRTVELHRDLWESNQDGIAVETPRDALRRKRETNWEGFSFPALADHDALLGQVLHAFYHILNFWCRPVCFLEIACFIARRRHDAAFWERFRKLTVRQVQLPQMAGVVFAMAEMLFDAPVPPHVAAWSTRALPAAMSLWVERHGREWAYARFPGSKLSLLLHRVFIEDQRTWKELERSRLLPFHRAAKVVECDAEQSRAQWRAGWEQTSFVLSRWRFHVAGLSRYLAALPAWKLLLWRAGTAASAHAELTRRFAPPAR